MLGKLFGKLFGNKDMDEDDYDDIPEETPAPPAIPEEQVRFIEHCLAHAVKIGQDYGETMDYSPASIQTVSHILDGYHRRYLQNQGQIREKLDAFASVFGVYIGETLLRNHPDSGYHWMEKPEFGLVVGKGDGYHIDAIAKAAKQIVNGREEGDEVVSFFDIAGKLMDGTLDLSQE